MSYITVNKQTHAMLFKILRSVRFFF